MIKSIVNYIAIFLFAGTGLYAQTNAAPQAVAFQDTVVMAELPLSYALDAAGSQDSDGTIVSYYWVVAQDTVGHEASTTISIDQKNTQVKLIVVDNEGASDSEVFTVYVGHPTNFGLNRIPFRNGSVPLFASGMNIAWNRFANDLANYDEQAQRYFSEVMDSVSSNGGNALRWWLHTNGAHSPKVDATGHVSGIDFSTIQNMKHILDMAFDHGIDISMCLWSFDMLQNNQQQDVAAMKLLLENPENVQSYVDNALIPILELLGDHPAVLTWEIFNEPEGMTNQFGWSSGGRISMFEIQRFINKCAGAIHREVPTALVSNGSWSFKASTDVGGNKNYYKDELLIEAGGDPDGVLDFYQVHYYPKHFGNDKSPFHRPADYWELDKPILIGEFPADAIDGKANPHYSVPEAYELALAYGYAGVMSWSWTDYNNDFTGTTGSGLQSVKALAPDAVMIPNASVALNTIPQAAIKIKPYRALLETIAEELQYQPLGEVFVDDQPDELTYSISEVSDVNFVTPTITNGVLGYTFPEPKAGLARVKVRAADPAGWYTDTEAIVMIGTVEGHETNLAYYQPVVSSAADESQFDIYANDGDRRTYWATSADGVQWIQMDLGEKVAFNFLSLDWGGHFATQYELQHSDDGESWTTFYADQQGVGRRQAIGLDEKIHTKHLRLRMLQSSNGRGYQLNEFMVESVPENSAPSILQVVDNYEVNVSDVRAINNYVRFSNVFTDLEHPGFLEFDIENNNEQLLTASKSIGNVGVSLLFEDNVVGQAVITLTATDPFGASVATSFEVIVKDNILGEDTSPVVLVYPNPTEDRVYVENALAPIVGFQLYDMEGKEVMTKTVDRLTSLEIDVSGLTAGYYLLHLRSTLGVQQVKINRK